MVGISTAPSKYGSIAVHGKEEPKFYVPRCGLVFYIMAFFGIFCVFALRASLSVAIVAMVNQTAITDDVEMTNTSDEGQCPRDPALRTADGEFIWDRHQQAAMLAAFFYGNQLTMVWCIINKKLNYRLASQTKNSLVDKIGERFGEIPR